MNLQFGLAAVVVVVAGFLLANKAGAGDERSVNYVGGPPAAHAVSLLR
jgi:hypothetical protein